MSEGVGPRWKSRLTMALVVGGLALLGAAGYFILHNPYKKSKADPSKPDRREENFLAQARTALAKRTDLATCKTAVQLLDNHLLKAAEQPPSLAPDAAARLRTRLGLDEKEAAEVAAPAYTPLDAHHLDSCFLFRDAARSLEIPPMTKPGGKAAKLTPLDLASAGFDWTVRQVRLADLSAARASEQAPPRRHPPPGRRLPAPAGAGLPGAARAVRPRRRQADAARLSPVSPRREGRVPLLGVRRRRRSEARSALPLRPASRPRDPRPRREGGRHARLGAIRSECPVAVEIRQALV